MSQLFTCPHCQTQTLVEDRYGGHVGRCVTCNGVIEVPRFAESSAIPARINSAISPTTKRFIAACLSVLIFAGLGGIAFQYGSPALNRLTASREQSQTIRNLEIIASALNAYAADHGTYPAPVISDSAGKAMHGWRVAILPYLGEQELYDQYDYSEPWDSPQNSLIIMLMPRVFAAPSNHAAGNQESQYQLVSGKGTLFPSSGPVDLKQISDDPTKTALVVEAFPPLSATGLLAVWTAPIELEIQTMSCLIGSNPGIEIGAVTADGVALATVAGQGHFLSDQTPPEIVRAILTASGGEPLADDVLD